MAAGREGLRRGVLRVGDRVVFDAAEHTVVAISGNAVRLHRPGADVVVMLPYLVGSSGFRLLEGGPPPRLTRLGCWTACRTRCGRPSGRGSGTWSRPGPAFRHRRQRTRHRVRRMTRPGAAWPSGSRPRPRSWPPPGSRSACGRYSGCASATRRRACGAWWTSGRCAPPTRPGRPTRGWWRRSRRRSRRRPTPRPAPVGACDAGSRRPWPPSTGRGWCRCRRRRRSTGWWPRWQRAGTPSGRPRPAGRWPTGPRGRSRRPARPVRVSRCRSIRPRWTSWRSWTMG
jgi:hypothetical protein